MKLYTDMCRTSPVQKDWKPKMGDNVYGTATQHIWSLPRSTIEHAVIDKDSGLIFWLPRQEDWQEILHKKKGYLNAWVKFVDFVNGFDSSKVMHLVETHKGLSNFYLIHWCLFVHKEVYGLEWVWDKNKWVKK